MTLRCVHTIINVVERLVGVTGVVDYHRSTETVAILRRQMTVVPERAGLVGR